MSQRYTEKDVITAFRLFCQELEIPCAHQYPAPVGSYALDKGMGGYQVVKKINEGGGLSTPFGWKRRSARDMVETLSFATEAHKISQREEQ